MANLVQIVISALDQTKDVFTKTIGGLNDIGKAADIAAGAMVGAGVAAAGAFTAMVGQAIHTSDEIGKQAQKVGILAEKWSELRYVAEINEVSSEQLVVGLKKLSVELQNVQNGNSDAIKHFEQLGVSALDSQGHIRALDGVISDLSESFSRHADGAEKAAHSLFFFGKSGVDLIPMMNQGKQGFADLGAEARSFGLIVGGEAAKNADEFHDNLFRLTSVLTGLARTVAGQVLPELLKFSEWMIGAVRDSGAVTGAVNTMKDGFLLLASGASVAWASLKSVLTAFVALRVEMLAVAIAIRDVTLGFAEGLALTAAKNPIKGINVIHDAVESLTAKLSAMKNVAGLAASEIGTNFSEAAAEVLKNISKMSSPLIPDILKESPSPKDGSSTSGKPNFPPPIDEKVLEKNSENAQKLQDAVARMWEVLTSEGAKARGDEIAAEDAKLQAQLAAIDRLGASEDEYYALREAAFKNHEERLTEIHDAEADKRAATTYELFLQQQERDRKEKESTIAKLGVMATALGNFAQASKALGKKGYAIYKAFATAQVIVDTAKGIVKAMAENPWPLNLVLASSMAAVGAAQLATIHGAEPGVAHAGLSYVPAESTYVLNQGERVLAPRQNTDLTSFLENNNGSGGGGMMHMIVNLDGRAILDYIGEATRNGTVELDARAVV